MLGSYLDDDGGLSSDFVVIEAPDSTGHKQALWAAVRPVWHGDQPSEEPVVQVCYQRDSMGSPLEGPLFLSLDTWRKLNQAVERRIAERKRKAIIGY